MRDYGNGWASSRHMRNKNSMENVGKLEEKVPILRLRYR
jgi:hypothetical protein